ncbi:hypothetical protein [Salibacterium halotolerans]|uniref:Uncharacterized protein n=1 Tax=Salibacterium halotolerans TaxID=1884432 RepID=A0A1I5LEI6_9BACI|nr:hypothetical protein [Salibacterium halotolerans]SFO95256.1 hypothetical protein SAMN05518683_101201 [Salibacterium halotolerans]
MIALCSLQVLRDAGRQIDELEHHSPELTAHLRHVVHLTKRLEFRCRYLGAMLRNQETDKGTEPNVYPSILRMYHAEVEKLKNREGAEKVMQLFDEFQHAGDHPLCQLITGDTPETIKYMD